MKKAMVFGSGLSGKGARRLLEKIGYEVVMVDDKDESSIKSSDAIAILDDVDIFIKSPGIPYVELIKKAMEKKINVVNEIEIAYRYMKENNIKSKLIAVTGTNGKTTVTTKITELLKFSGFRAEYSGNIGVSFAELILNENELDYIVLELSSFQLENINTFRADISMVINLTPDHLERYKNLEEYYLTKFKICNLQEKENIFILNRDSCEIKEILNNKISLKNKIITISKEETSADYYVDDNKIKNRNGNEILECDKIALKGKHNLENMLFVVAVAKILNIEDEKIKSFLYNTKTIEHRMEIFHKFGNITFINDSKGTNIEASKYAIEACTDCILICGGYDKKLDWMPLAQLIKKYTKQVYLIGQIATILKELLLELGYESKNIFTLNDIEHSLEYMKKHMDKNLEQVVLLSPSTSSYDQFSDFEMRGKIFKKLVRNIFV
ncbi:MAG: UDP-N-acetylmuramoyl-L-alanine--D-glutamate ligase [Fusobacteriaceae bacterium]|jgi:UDP-N-acetylmuramoylalanine--D-glutamate ligase|nr:UDP-N-acetylmuramoyl-L-alanine--D-glutamate ligase [Fusobacteriaceae bacterium]